MFRMKRNYWLLAGLLAGLMLIWYGLGLAMWRDAQTTYYNVGLQAYKNGDLPTAVMAFDRSVSIYKQGQRLTFFQKLVYPKPSAEIAAQADFQKAKALIRAQQLPAAVDAMKESLYINPGNGYVGVSYEDAERMHKQAMDVKYDLELLFKNNPELAKGQGKGKPKDGDGDGRNPVPGTNPGNKPGKGDRNDI